MTYPWDRPVTGHGNAPAPDDHSTPQHRRVDPEFQRLVDDFNAANERARDAYHARPDKCGECGRFIGAAHRCG